MESCNPLAARVDATLPANGGRPASRGKFVWTGRPGRLVAPARLAVALLLAATLAWLAGCASVPYDSPPQTRVRVLLEQDGRPRIRTLSLEDYVTGVILAELAVGNEDVDTAARILAVQALVTRTYAVANLGRHASDGYDLCTTTHCQVYRDPRGGAKDSEAIAREAARRTAGQVVAHQRRPIHALFHSNCGGHTSAADEVWGGTQRAYLVARPDSYCPIDTPASWSWSVDAKELRAVLDGDERTRGGSGVRSVTVVERDVAGRATAVAIGPNRVVRGETLRAVVMRRYGPHSVRSTRFTVRRDGSTFRFAGNGYGHGAGMCQIGALARARAGESPAAILQHYYPGTDIEWYRPSAVAP